MLATADARSRLYAVAFDFDREISERLDHTASWRNAVRDERRSLEEIGFETKQRSVDVARDDIDAVELIVVVQDRADAFGGFTPAHKAIRSFAPKKTTI